MTTGDPTVYCGCAPVVDTGYDAASGQSPTEAIVDALANAEDVTATELPPLYETIDTDAVNRLFDRDERGAETGAIFNFQIESWSVFVRADGRVRVCDATQSTDPAPVFEDAPI